MTDGDEVLPDLPDFRGKIGIFYVADAPPGDAVTLEYMEPRRLGGRLFVVGRVPEIVQSRWVSKLQAGVAWETVLHYVLFDSKEEYEARVPIARPGIVGRVLGRGAG